MGFLFLALSPSRKVRTSVGETVPFAGQDSSEHPSQKSFMDMSLMSPYRKPTQVGWRKCAKVNG
ncbi:MAG: hypothetical protein Greene071421_4 [Parcubacteria group bacterium Greene0714_21]|nr:MAG: hypothetical protein Greene041639_402 [Parcubacteria group bacterium Greene0416_39]TSD04518.1 MAG: hypothetical protein Greene071421_4 [Parcubacteria group bacterium Greene0714_21]